MPRIDYATAERVADPAREFVFDADPGADQAIEPARHSWIRAQSKVVTDHIATDPEDRAFLDHWATSETSSR